MKISIKPNSPTIIIIVILSFLGININLFAQKDSVFLNATPKREFNYSYSYGRLSDTKFHPISGPNIFTQSINHGWELSFQYAQRLDNKWKFSVAYVAGRGSFETIYRVNNETVPGIDKYFTNDISNNYGRFNHIFTNTYFNLPLNIHYKIYQLGSKHDFWLLGGIGFKYIIPAKYVTKSYHSFENDTTQYNIYSIAYSNNPEENFKLRFNLGMEYRYQLPNYHELIFGINYAFHPKDMYTGVYETLSFAPELTGKGTVSYRMNLLSLSVGYSFNKKKKRLKQMKLHKDGPILPPDTMVDIKELRFGTNPSFYLINPKITNQTSTIVSEAYKRQALSLTVHYQKYFRDNWSWYTGIDAYYSFYSWEIIFPYNQYPFLKPYSRAFYDKLFAQISIPFGIQKDFRIGKRNFIELAAAPQLSVNLGYVGHHTLFVHNNDTSYIGLDVNTPLMNYITPGAQFKLGYTRNTKRMNKWAIGIRASIQFMKISTMEYSILNPDKTYYHGEVDFQPFDIQLYWRYILTGKRKRYLKTVGY